MENEIEVFYPKNQAEWRNWLQENHISKQAVRVVFYKKNSGVPSLTWSESVDEALCFGWIDSKKISVGDNCLHQFFSKRKPKSNWSKINKIKVEELIAKGLMTKAGFDSIELAKQNGSWTYLDSVEELVIPQELEDEFVKNRNAKNFFLSSSNSYKKLILYWLLSAKTDVTRKKRLAEIIESGEQNLKPKHLR
jgi:uncharacterized protein YdeI (YjbR/CyaY-like superfamily)